MAYRQNVPSGGGSGALSMPGRQVCLCLPRAVGLYVCVCVCFCAQECFAVARAPGDRALPQGKMGTANTAQDLSEKLEEYQSGQFKMPDEIKRALQMIRMLDDKVDEARAQIRKESEEYVCAKDHKSAASLELKAKIDSRQSNCLSWAEQKESQAAMCVDLVNREMMKLDEYIANIDESIFTNMEEEDVGAARGAAGGMGSRSGGGGIGGGGHDRKRKSGGGDRNAWIQEGAMCEVGWNPNCWAVLTCMQFCTHACTYTCIHARAPSLYACTCVGNNDVCAYPLSLSLSLSLSSTLFFLHFSLCQVEWDGEYWQATIIRLKMRTQGGGIGSARSVKSEVLDDNLGVEW